MNTEAIKELKRLADQCICHPVSRSIGEIEQAGEAIKDLIARLDAVEKELAAIRALEPVAWANPYGGFLSDPYMKNFAIGLEKQTHTVPLYALPEQK